MDKKDMVIVGLVVLLVLVVAFSGSILPTGLVGDRSCSDTDGGSAFVKGTISGTDSAGNSFSMTDYCSGDNANIVKEYTCDPDSKEGWNTVPEYCEKGCSDGACLS